ncbi:MAG: carboxypeptidase regulatory-like domain-containing protein, partial [Promethearchaeota archaeon]
MLNKNKKIYSLLILGIVIFSLIPFVNANDTKTVINNEFEEPNDNGSKINWRPIEESLNYDNLETSQIGDPTATTSYNLVTGEQLTTPTPESTPSYPSIIEGNPGLLGGDTSESVIGGDGRVRITPTTSYPWRTIVKIYITAADSSNWVGSGAMLDNFHVLTAGHVAYLPSNGGWASSLRIVPAMDNLAEPYGEAFATYMRSYTGWTVSNSPQHDWAVLTLDRNIGSYTGWMGRITAGSGHSIYTETMNVAGYPTDRDGGINMYFDSDAGDGATENNHYYWADTAGGMSGGPVWRYVSGNRYIMTVHAYGRGGTDSNYGTRLNSDKYNRINTWLAADAGSSPSDKADLEDRGSSYSGYNTGTVTPGVTSFSVWSDVQNQGTASSGGFYVRYYASTNTLITNFDYFIGSDYVPSVSPFNKGDSIWSGIFPISLPAGNYYIGWIIDQEDYVDEFDETDNTAYRTSQITVNPPPPPPSAYVEVQVNDSVTDDPVLSAYVTCWDSGNSLIRTGFTDASGFFNITGLDVDTYNVTVSKVGYRIQKQLDVIDFTGDDDYLQFNLVAYAPDSSYIEVRVNDSRTYNPIQNAYVRCFNYSSGELFSSGYTDNNGFYNITGLYIGWWEVNVTYPGFNEMSKLDYINWNNDDDYLFYYMDVIFEPINESVALFRDNLPWEVNSTEPILQKYNISYTVYSSLDFGSVDLSQYQKVILASEQVQTFYDRLEGNVTWFEDYAANGGILELHSVDRKGFWDYRHNGTWRAYLYPGGLNKTYNVTLVNNQINMPTHPFLLKPYKLNESQVDGWIGGVFTVYPSNARKILLGPTSDPILIEFSYGSGYIIASTQTLEWNANWAGTQQLYENLILYNPLNYHYPNIANVKIDLYRNAVFIMEVVGSTPNDGDFLWIIADGLVDSTQYQFKISDAAYTLTSDDSEIFEIFNPSITVVEPVSTSAWSKGSSKDINWTSRGTIPNVKIELYKDGILE